MRPPWILAALLAASCAPGAITPDAPAVRSSGVVTLTRGSVDQCGERTIRRTLVVRGNQASVLYNPRRNLTATGTVQPDGSFILNNAEYGVSLQGRIDGDTARAVFVSASCGYDFNLARES